MFKLFGRPKLQTQYRGAYIDNADAIGHTCALGNYERCHEDSETWLVERRDDILLGRLKDAWLETRKVTPWRRV